MNDISIIQLDDGWLAVTDKQGLLCEAANLYSAQYFIRRWRKLHGIPRDPKKPMKVVPLRKKCPLTPGGGVRTGDF